MARLQRLVLVCFCSLCLADSAFAQAETNYWEIFSLSDEGGLVFDGRVAIATNAIRVKWGNAVLEADRVALDQQSGDAIADGRVRIQHLDQLWASEHIRYNFFTRQMEAEHFRTGKSPVFAAGAGLHADTTNRVYAATNAFITTDDVYEPTFRIRAKYLKIIPNDRIEAHHATLYVRNVPVFYFPFYSRRLQAQANNWNFVPGYRSRFGPFLLSTYTWLLNEQLDGAVHLDYRVRRGVGAGPDLNYHLGRWGDGSLKYYYLHDEDPNAELEDQPINDDRQRVYFSYQSSPITNLEVKALVRYQSDIGIVREFFEREYRQNQQPSTYLEVRKFWENFSLDVYTQPRVNDFFETVERLPDVRLTGFRQRLGDSPLFYESESSAGYYRRLFADTNGPAPLDFEAARADTFHQLVLPHTFFGWLNVMPRVGGRFTYYGRARGPGATTEELYRGVFNTGAEINFKASRLWPASRSEALQVDGLRHIIQPSVNYVYVPNPTHRGTNELPQFDYELTSLRLLPIEFPDYNAIDSIDGQNGLRLGLRNKLQTKRQGQIDNLLDWDVYTDWRLDARQAQTTFTDLYSDLAFKPRSAITLESVTRFNLDNGNFRMSFHTLTLQPNYIWSWSVGHFYLRDDFSDSPTALGEGNNLITSSIFYRLNENWGLRLGHHFEARDGRMEEQHYTIYRDLRSWTAALTVRLRDNRDDRPDDVSVAFTFSLKSFPRYPLSSDLQRPYLLLGR